MHLASVLLAPMALLLPTASAVELSMQVADVLDSPASTQSEPAAIWPQADAEALEGKGHLGAPWSAARIFIQSIRPQDAWQVRIEQRVQIRITPRMPMAPDIFDRGSDPEPVRRSIERKIGNCVTISGIGGVETDKANRLLLYMRDRRVIVAELERSCRSRDFYSGFYLSRTSDGQLCVDRDTLLSRSGANCKLTRIRQRIEDPDR